MVEGASINEAEGGQRASAIRHFGPWASVGLAFGLFLAAELVPLGAIYIASGRLDISDSPALGHLYLVAHGVIGLLLAYIVVYRRSPKRVFEHLGIVRVAREDVMPWVWLAVGYFFIAGVMQYLVVGLFDLQAAQAIMVAGLTAMSILGIVILIPIFEEVLFRGILLLGLEPTRLGPTGAMLVSSAGWAALHSHYHWVMILVIFGFGIILGLSRLSTRSLTVPILLHMAFNGTGQLVGFL